MTSHSQRIRVLYGFPHKIGADRICTTAWYQVERVSNACADVLVFPGVVHRQLPPQVRVRPTLARGDLRLPYRVLGRVRTLDLHDLIVAQRLPKLAGQIDVVQVWPLGARRTIEAGAKLGIPTGLERPNAHMRFAYEIVRAESERLGMDLPPGHEHAFSDQILSREEDEYRAADYLLCPSDFAMKAFEDEGDPKEQLLRHIYGFDPKIFYPAPEPRRERPGPTVLIVGVAAVRKGQHLALEACLDSPASGMESS